MSVEEELSRISPVRETLLAIGVFDGVHIGHQALLNELKSRASRRDLASGVVTFRQHPQSVLKPYSDFIYLTDLSQKIRLLKDQGVNFIVALTFSQELAALSAEKFTALLKKHLKMKGLVVGEDFALGKKRQGDAVALGRIGEEKGFTVTVVPPEKLGGEVVSSTAIKAALAAGDIGKAAKMLGRPFRLEGHVVTGDGRGGRLGFPTANLDLDAEQALPVDGVYAGWAYIRDKWQAALLNIGMRPTFGAGRRIVEVYVLDFEGDLYDSHLIVDIIDRLRGEVRFSSADELKKQIEADIERGRAILK